VAFFVSFVPQLGDDCSIPVDDKNRRMGYPAPVFLVDAVGSNGGAVRIRQKGKRDLTLNGKARKNLDRIEAHADDTDPAGLEIAVIFLQLN